MSGKLLFILKAVLYDCFFMSILYDGGCTGAPTGQGMTI